MTHEIPKLQSWDSTLPFRYQGYDFIRSRCDELASDIFQANILFQPTLCMYGEEWAQLFQDETLFSRQGASPGIIKSTLFGHGGVQGLDDEEHRHRKAMFMNIMTRQRLDRLEEIAHSLWINETMQWSAQSASLALKEKISHILCQAVCQWVGLHITTERVPRLARHLLNLVEGASSIGIAHLRARASRRHLESWSASLIREIRCGERKAEDDCILRVIALHEQTHGDLLPERIAAVELLNILRPTVAVTYYILLAAVALHDHPQEAGNITDDRSLTHFVQEVRRYYPFFPVVAARVRQDFEWNGYRFPQGYRALLDLYASNHDERVWETPQRFLPQRFGNARQSPFILIPQGGGDPWRHHRCAGEALTVDMMKLAVKMLNAEITYDVQSSTSLHGIPAQPAHGLRIFRVASNLAHRTV